MCFTLPHISGLVTFQGLVDTCGQWIAALKCSEYIKDNSVKDVFVSNIHNKICSKNWKIKRAEGDSLSEVIDGRSHREGVILKKAEW